MEKILSVIMPVYNEQKTLAAIIDKVLAVPFVKELIIVDDCSTDGSARVLEGFRHLPGVKVIHHAHNQGKGAAIRSGIEHITGAVTIVQDADLEYDPQDYAPLVKPIVAGTEQVVYGSRFLSVHLNKQKNAVIVDRPNLFVAMVSIITTIASTIIRNKLGKKHIEQPHAVFFLGGVVVTLITNVLYSQRLTDEPTCYKTFDSALLKSMDLQCERFEFCPEVTAKVARRGIKIMELPIRYYPRKVEEGKKIKWYDGAEAIWTLLKYRFVKEHPKKNAEHLNTLLAASETVVADRK